jgi:hypothetical protein
MVDVVTLGLVVLPFFGGLVGYVLKRLSVFEVKEWRKRKRKKKKWYDEVERTANGIQGSWHYSGARPEEEDKERTAERMDEYTDELQEYKRHQNATDEMVETMNEIIQRWDDSRENIVSFSFSQYYYMRDIYFTEDAEHLKQLLGKARKGRIRSALSATASKLHHARERLARWWYNRKSFPLPFDLYTQVRDAGVSKQQINQFVDGDVFLDVKQDYTEELVYYERDENTYYPLHIDHGPNGDVVVVDSLSGKSLRPEMLIWRAKSTESIDTIPTEDVVPDGQSWDEFKDVVTG